jgi:hypothetical protein
MATSFDVAHAIVVMSYGETSSDIAPVIVVISYMVMSSELHQMMYPYMTSPQ